MTVIIIALVSIYLIAAVAALKNKIFGWKICPICAGVSGTWLWMLLGMLTGQLPIANFQLPVAILMGGSVVGIAYQLEKRLPPGRSPLRCKMIFIPLGFLAAYALLAGNWPVFLATGLAAAIFALYYTRKPSGDHADSAKVKELEEKMKKCC